MDLTEIKAKTWQQIRELEAFVYLLNSEDFKSAVRIGNIDEIKRYIDSRDRVNIERWIDQVLGYERLTVIILRQRVKLIGIKEYNMLTKNELVGILTNAPHPSR